MNVLRTRMVVLTFAPTQLVAICARVNQATISPVMNEHVMVSQTNFTTP